MAIIFKLTAAVVVSLVLLIILEKGEKHIAVLLSVAICCMSIAVSAEFLRPIVKLIKQLQRSAEMDGYFLSQLIKAAAAAAICEITAVLCTESGYSSLGKTVQRVGNFVILYLSIPLITALMDLITDILGGL